MLRVREAIRALSGLPRRPPPPGSEAGNIGHPNNCEAGTMFDYKGKRWRRLAARALRRDKYKCQLSRRYGKNVEAEMVHHIYPVDEYPEYAYCMWNLISLSRAMHNTLHDRNTDKLTPAGVALMRRTKKP